MPRTIRVCLLCVALTMMLLTSACVPSIDMKRAELSRANLTRNTVIVGTVLNKRAEDNGGKDFEVIGKVRGGYGNPFTVKTERGRELDVVLKDMAKAALEHTGYATSRGAGKSFRLDMDLLNFWCDGYTGYKIEAEVAVKLVDPVKGKVLAQKRLHAQRGFAIVASYGQMHDAFDEIINDIQKQTVTFMQSQEFKNAAK